MLLNGGGAREMEILEYCNVFEYRADLLNVSNITNSVGVNSLDWRKFIALNIWCFFVDLLFGPNFA